MKSLAIPAAIALASAIIWLASEWIGREAISVVAPPNPKYATGPSVADTVSALEDTAAVARSMEY